MRLIIEVDQIKLVNVPPFRENSMTHTTTRGSTAWWKVTLDQTYLVDKIHIYNREDCCQQRIDGVTVYLGKGGE